MVLHALFGNEQDGCSSHQAAADHIEQGSADTAGGGQGNAAGFVVDDGGVQFGAFKINSVSVVRCRNDDFSFVTGTVTGRRGGLLQVVSTGVQTLDIELTLSSENISSPSSAPK